MSTLDIKGFFSQEHKILVFLICISLYGNWTTYQKLNELTSEVKLLTYRVNHENTKRAINLDQTNIFRHKGQCELQTSSPLLAVIRRNPLYCYECED